MGFNFPSSPTIGQLHPPTATPGLPQYTWDGITWTMRGTPINPKIIVSDTPPASPETGSMWWNGSNGKLYVYYFDGDASFWVQAAASLSDVDQSQLLKKAGDTMAGPLILAADPTAEMQAADKRYVDMMAASNIAINGGFEVNQELGGTPTSKTLGAWNYPADQWQCWVTGNGTFATEGLKPSSLATSRGIRIAQRLYCGTAFNMAGSSDLVTFIQPVEGSRWAKLAYGSINAQPVTVSFWVYATVAGTLSMFVRNAASNRFYVVPVIITAGNAWEYKNVPVPGDVTGTWPTDNTMGAQVGFTFGAGSGYQGGTNNAWAASANIYAHTGVTNFFAGTNNEVWMAGVSIVPGNIGPSAAQSPLLIRTYIEELALCKRYWQRLGQVGALGYASTYNGAAMTWPEMRVAPASVVTGQTLQNCGAITISPNTPNGGRVYCTIPAPGYFDSSNGSMTLNARM